MPENCTIFINYFKFTGNVERRIITREDIGEAVRLESGKYVVIEFCGLCFARRADNPSGKWKEIEIIYWRTEHYLLMQSSKEPNAKENIFSLDGEKRSFWEGSEEYSILDNILNRNNL